MRYVIFTLFVASLPTSVLADSASFKYGLGIIEGAATTKVKAFALRLEERSNVFHPFYSAVEGGLWTDTGRAEGRRGSGYATAQLGVRPASEHVYFKAFIGPALITAVDSQLGGVLQFRSDAGVGFQDDESFVGLALSHISSAGLWAPNKGRDSLQLELGIHF